MLVLCNPDNLEVELDGFTTSSSLNSTLLPHFLGREPPTKIYRLQKEGLVPTYSSLSNLEDLDIAPVRRAPKYPHLPRLSRPRDRGPPGPGGPPLRSPRGPRLPGAQLPAPRQAPELREGAGCGFLRGLGTASGISVYPWNSNLGFVQRLQIMCAMCV